MEYQVSLRGIQVARMAVAIGEPGFVDNHPAIIMRSRATSGGILSMIGSLTWELTTTIDTSTGLPLSEHEVVDVEFAGKHEHQDETRNWSAGDTRLNVHSAAGVLRAWRSQLGDTKALDVSIESAYIDLALADVGREFAVNQPAVRYAGKARGQYPATLWVSDDAARVPLRMVADSKWGEIEVILGSYEAPKL